MRQVVLVFVASTVSQSELPRGTLAMLSLALNFQGVITGGCAGDRAVLRGRSELNRPTDRPT